MTIRIIAISTLSSGEAIGDPTVLEVPSVGAEIGTVVMGLEAGVQAGLNHYNIV